MRASKQASKQEHSKESRGVLGQASKQAGKGKEGSFQGKGGRRLQDIFFAFCVSFDFLGTTTGPHFVQLYALFSKL